MANRSTARFPLSNCTIIYHLNIHFSGSSIAFYSINCDFTPVYTIYEKKIPQPWAAIFFRLKQRFLVLKKNLRKTASNCKIDWTYSSTLNNSQNRPHTITFFFFYCNLVLVVTFGLWLSWTLQQYIIYHVYSHMVFIKSNFTTISSLVVVRPKLTIKLYLYESQKAKSKNRTNRDLIKIPKCGKH